MYISAVFKHMGSGASTQADYDPATFATKRLLYNSRSFMNSISLVDKSSNDLNYLYKSTSLSTKMDDRAPTERNVKTPLSKSLSHSYQTLRT